MEDSKTGPPGGSKAEIDKLMLAAAGEVLVAITDEADLMVERSIDEVLRVLQQLVNLDVVFFSRFASQHQVVRNAVGVGDQPLIVAGDAFPYEKSWCKRVIDGKLPELIPDTSQFGELDFPATPFPVGTYMSAPVVLDDGSVYGTVCSLSQAPKPVTREQEYAALLAIATLLSSHVRRSMK